MIRMELHIYLASRYGQQPLIYYLLFLSFSQYALAQSGRDDSSPTDSIGLILLGVGAVLFFGCFLPLCIIRNCLGSPNTTTATTDPPGRINTNRGVDQKVIETFPLVNYAAIKHMRASNSPLECAICLTEFLIDDTLQLLPGCRHVFHVNCIDTWLAEHKTCPVCRSNLSDPKVIAGKRLLSLKIESEDVPCSSSNMSEQVVTKMDVLKSKGPRHVQSMPREWERFTLILPDDVTKDIKTTHDYRKAVSFQDYTNKGNAGTDRGIQSFMNSLSWNQQQKGKNKVSVSLEISEASNSANISRKLFAFSDQGENEMLEMDFSWTQTELENLPVHDRV